MNVIHIKMKRIDTLETLEMEVSPNQTIYQVKQALVETLKTKPSQLTLMFEGDVLEDNTLLNQIQFKLDPVMILYVEPGDDSLDGISLTIRDCANRPFQITVSPTISLDRLRSLVSQQMCVMTSFLRLQYNGNILEGPATIDSVGISANSVIEAFTNVLGGD